jgi:hypothetical protein
LKPHKKGIKVERRKTELSQLGFKYMYTWNYHKETPCVFILNKNVIFLFYEIREQEVWPGGVIGTRGGRKRWGKGMGG